MAAVPVPQHHFRSGGVVLMTTGLLFFVGCLLAALAGVLGAVTVGMNGVTIEGPRWLLAVVLVGLTGSIFFISVGVILDIIPKSRRTQ